MFLFYLRGKSRRRDGGHVLGAQVLRGVGPLPPILQGGVVLYC